VPAREERTDEVDGDRLLPLRRLALPGGADRAEDAGVVHQDIDSFELCKGGGDQSLDLELVAHIGWNRQDVRSDARKLGGCGLEVFGVCCAERDPSSLLQ